MAVPTDPVASSDRPSPAEVDAIATRTFPSSFRGWDPDEVRVHLVKVAELVRSLTQRQSELERRLAEAETAARRADTSQLDPDEIAEVLGEETARVLRTARESAAEMRTKAEERVAQLSKQAADDAARIRGEAEAERDAARKATAEEAAAMRAANETLVADLRAEAESQLAAQRATADDEIAAARQAARDEAAELAATSEDQAAAIRRDAETDATKARDNADAYATKVRTDADIYADRVRSEADDDVASRTAVLESEIARARDELEHDVEERRASVEAELATATSAAEVQVAEAERMRDRVLADLARKRKAARQHLEQLRAGRDRLLEAYDVVKATTDQATRELGVVLPDAKRLADEAARRVGAEPDPSVNELHAELDLARDADLPIVLPSERTDLEVADEGTDLDAGEADAVVADDEADDETSTEPDVTTSSDDAADDAIAIEAEETAEPVAAVTASSAPSVPEAPASGSTGAAITPAAKSVVAPIHPPTGKLHGRRKGRRDPLGGASLPEAPLEPVEVGAEFETVRLVESPVDAEPRAGGDAAASGEAAGDSSADAGTTADVHETESAPVKRSATAAEAALAAMARQPTASPSSRSGDQPAETADASERTDDDLPAEPGEALASDVADDRAAIEPVEPVADQPVEPAAEPDVAGIFERLRREQATPGDPAPAEPASEAAPGAAKNAAAHADDEISAADPVLDAAAARLAEMFERRDAAVDEVGKRLAKKVKRLLSDNQSELLDELRRAKKRPSAEQLFAGQPAFVEALADATRANLGGAVAAGVTLAGDLHDGSAERADVDIDETVRELVESLADSLQVRLTRALGEGTTTADLGDDAPVPLDDLELADAIRACYREFRGARLTVAVTDACASAFGLGLRAALPADVGLRWFTDRNDRPCSDCDDNRLAGVVPSGERFPTGQFVPPAHQGCRCVALPPVDGLPDD